MLNAIEQESPLANRHRITSELVVCLRGRLVEEFNDEMERRFTEAIELSPNGARHGAEHPHWSVAYRTGHGVRMGDYDGGMSISALM